MQLKSWWVAQIRPETNYLGGKKMWKRCEQLKVDILPSGKKFKSYLERCSWLKAFPAQTSTKYWYEEKYRKKEVMCVLFGTFHSKVLR